MNENEQVPTNIPGLDRVFGGGLRPAGLHLIAGAPGTGKTILAHQIAARYLRSGKTVLYITALVESHKTLVAQARRFEFFDESWVGTQLYYVSLYPAFADGGVTGVREEVGRLIREHGPDLVILDGLHVIKSAASSDFEFTRFVNELQALSSIGGTTMLAISNVTEERAGSGEFAMSDAVIRLARELYGRRLVRTVEIEKLRGADILTGTSVFTISAAGIRVFPRLEGVVAQSGVPPTTPAARTVRFGIPGLDAMVGGGLSSASVTMVAGVPGAGKTLTGLSFLAAGAADGERGLFAGFHETPDRLVAKAERTGVPIRDPVEDGRVRMVWRSSTELLADEFAEDIFGLIDEHDIRRLVIDGLDDLGRMFVVPRVTAFLNAFTDLLRNRGVTVVVTQEIRTIFGPDFRIPMGEVSAAVDNIILLRYIELRARIRRLISILKVREREYDTRIRAFEITRDGIEVGEPLEETESLLSGFGRLAESKAGSE